MGMEKKEAAAPSASWVQIILIGRNPRFTLVRIVVLVVTCFVVAKFILLPIRVEGGSMLPTYHNGVNFVNRLAYVSRDPQRGDVVALRLAGHSIMFMKRIVGMPGETVAFHRGHVYINGKLLPEPYVKLECDWERPAVTLEADQYFVVGDNRSMALEDHTMGEPHRNRIVGKILL
jgi:signal peptidase I